MGFKVTKIFIFFNNETKVIITIHIDDIFIIVFIMKVINFIKVNFNIKYKIKDLGETKWFLKIEIIRNHLKEPCGSIIYFIFGIYFKSIFIRILFLSLYHLITIFT